VTLDAFPPLGELFVRRPFDRVGFSPLVASVMKIPPARSALARSLPSGENSTLLMKSACFFIVQTSTPSATR
jgi:hypothetical protein